MQTIVSQATGAKNAAQQLKRATSRQSLGSPSSPSSPGLQRTKTSNHELEAEDTDLWKFLCEVPLDVDSVEEHIRVEQCETNLKDKTFGWSPVLLAANAGEAGLLKLLLGSKAKSDVVCHEGNSALILAARRGHLDTVEFLMSKKVDLNVKNTQGWSALHWSCINGHEDIATTLLAASADFNVVDNDGRTACMWAARHGYLEILEALLLCGINLGAQDYEGLTAMDHAQEHMELRTVIAAAEEVNQDLLSAARRADKQEVRLAIQRGANLNMRDENGWDAMMWSALHGSLDLCTMLVRHGANPKIRVDCGDHINKLGDQHLAIGDSLTNIVGANDRMLDKAKEEKWDQVDEELKIGAWINVRDKDKRTALMWAARHGAPEAISKLVSKGAHTDLRDVFGWTATLFAVWSKSFESLAMLYYLSADFAIHSFEGDSALHVAARGNDGVMVQLLLASKSDVEELDVQGYSPLMLAASLGLRQAASTLLAWGGSTKTTDRHNRNAFMLAIVNGHISVVQLMLEPLQTPPPIPGFESTEKKKKKKFDSNDKKDRPASGKKGRPASGRKLNDAETHQPQTTPKKSDAKVVFAGNAGKNAEAKRSSGRMSSASMAKLKDVNAPRATKCDGPTTLIQMAATGRSEVVAKLPKISAKTLLKETDKNGRAPLHLSVVHKNIDIMQLLIAKASDINAVDIHGNTALHEAALRDQEQIVIKLIDGACNIEMKNKEGKMPVELTHNPSIKGMLQGMSIVAHSLPVKEVDPETGEEVEHAAHRRKSSSKIRPVFKARIEGLPTNLTSDILENRVSDLIKRLGTSNSAKIEVAVDPITARPHGYAIAAFSDAAEVDLAIRGDGIVMEGSTLRIFKEIAPKKISRNL